MALTNLDACTAYRVRVRTRCGPTDFSDFTAWLPFETASTNPCVSLTVEEGDGGCVRAIYATQGFTGYIWNDGQNSMETDTVYAIMVSKADTFWVYATDEFGCTADAFHIVATLPSNCLTFDEDLELLDSLASDSLRYAQDMQLLALGMAALSGNDTIKSLVKAIVLFNNSENHQEYVAYFEQLIDSCTTRGIDLIARLQEAAWANRLPGEAMDTNRIRAILTNYVVADSRATVLRPLLSYVYLNPEYQNPAYSSWDSVSVDYVVAASMHSIDAMPTYQLIGNQVNRSVSVYTEWQRLKPVWQIGFGFDFLNGYNTKESFSGNTLKAGCYCNRHGSKTEEGVSTHYCNNENSDCGPPPCSGTCTRLERILTWIDSLF